jgi:hypothetical protein
MLNSIANIGKTFANDARFKAKIIIIQNVVRKRTSIILRVFILSEFISVIKLANAIKNSSAKNIHLAISLDDTKEKEIIELKLFCCESKNSAKSPVRKRTEI